MTKLFIPFLFIFILIGCNQFQSDSKVIGILPYEGISAEEVDSVERILDLTYGYQIVILNQTKLPKEAFTKVRSPRYRADSLIRIQSRTLPDSISLVIGLTNKDISTTKYQKDSKKIKYPENIYKDWGIFGLGQVGGNSCVVSTYRLHNNANKSKFYTRLKRIATHEVGHILGLSHCPTLNCVMNDANETIKTIDNSTGKLCNNCKKKINL